MFGQLSGQFFVVGAVLCIVGCLAASLASTYCTVKPSPSPVDNQMCPQTFPIAKCFLRVVGAKSLQVENHLATERIDHGTAVYLSPGSLLEMLTVSPHPGPAESESAI